VLEEIARPRPAQRPALFPYYTSGPTSSAARVTKHFRSSSTEMSSAAIRGDLRSEARRARPVPVERKVMKPLSGAVPVAAVNVQRWLELDVDNDMSAVGEGE
jgi:hypothetical protein